MAPSFYAALIGVSRMQTVNGQNSWLVGGRTYLDFAEAVRAARFSAERLFPAGRDQRGRAGGSARAGYSRGGHARKTTIRESEWPISAELDKLFG